MRHALNAFRGERSRVYCQFFTSTLNSRGSFQRLSAGPPLVLPELQPGQRVDH